MMTQAEAEARAGGPGAEALPFDGAISAFFEQSFPGGLRERVRAARGREIVSEGYPYARRLGKRAYRSEHAALQIELVKLQAWVRDTGQRVVLLVEGRDAAGKGGTIRRLRRNMNPRRARVVALGRPTEIERGQWYFQRYVAHLPGAGEIVFFDRSWYNRAVVERVFGFSSEAERARFFAQVGRFEEMLADEGIALFKLWLTVGRAEQMRRMLARERDPLKQWKLSRIDVDSLGLWDRYTEAIADMFARTHRDTTPWRVIRADDKRRARLAAARLLLSALPYAGRDEAVACPPDPAIAGAPDMLGEASD
jgi:polyphosphate kinase 2